MANNLKNINLQEISLVDRGANKGSKVALWKRDQAGELAEVVKMVLREDENQPVDFIERLKEEMQQRQMMEIEEEMHPLIWALRDSIEASVANLSDEERDTQIRENVENFLSAVRMKMGGETMEKAMREVRKSAGSPGTTNQEANMTPEELEKKLGDLETQVDTITKERDAEKAEREAMTKAAEDAGLTVTKADDGTVSLEKAAEPEYIEVNGEKLEKSAVPEPLLKQIEADRARLKKMEQEREAETLAKRAESELPNLKGTAEEKGALIKAVDSIEDESVRKSISETLKAADAATSKMFSEVGKSAADDEDSATYKLNKMASDIAEKEGLTFHQGFVKAVDTTEGRKLREEMSREG